MRVLIYWLVLLPLPALTWAATSSVSTIPIYAQFHHEPNAVVLASLETELKSIMKPVGLTFEWHSLDTVRGDEVSVRLVVLRFNGDCNAAATTGRNSDSDLLGWTYGSHGALMPFSDVDCDAVREVVLPGLRNMHASEQQELLGRALGRVIAHELYHVLGNTSAHHSGGIEQARYGIEDLLNASFRFDEQELAVLRAVEPTARKLTSPVRFFR